MTQTLRPDCAICGKPKRSLYHKICRDPECARENKRRDSAEYHAKQRQKKWENGIGADTIICAICGRRMNFIAPAHLRKHGMTLSDYQERYSNHPIMSPSTRKARGLSALRSAKRQTYNGHEPDIQLYEFLTGALLGDGSIEHAKLNARYVEGGSNEAYLRWKYAFLSRYFPCTFKERLSAPHTKTQKQYRGWWLRTSSHPLLTEWHRQWYRPHKIVPFELVEQYLTPFALAIWFCDDGSANKHSGKISTQAFTRTEVSELIAILQSRFGLMAKCGPRGEINFNAVNIRQLQNIVRSYLIPGMEYKYLQTLPGESQ
jgi:hypothetical protein